MYLLVNPDRTIKGVSTEKFSDALYEISNDFFSNYPQECWELNDNDRLVKKENADQIRIDFWAEVDPSILTEEELAQATPTEESSEESTE